MLKQTSKTSEFCFDEDIQMNYRKYSRFDLAVKDEHQDLPVALSYEGKDSSKFQRGSALYGGGGGRSLSPLDDGGIGIITAFCAGIVR